MRITGLATGLDMDQVIKDSMKPYRVKIQKQQQNKEVIEIKQKLYRDVIKDSREFYNKYLDILKSDSILQSKNWSTVKFQSSDDSIVSVTAGSGVKGGNYTIKGTSATAAKATKTEGIGVDDKIVINGKEFTLKGETESDRAKNLNKELSDAKINVTVRYTEFAGSSEGVNNNQKGFVFESKVLGENGKFTIGGSVSNVKGDKVDGIDATGATVTGDGFTIDNLKTASSIKIGDTTINLDEIKDDTLVNDDIIKILNNKISDKKLTASVDESGKITFTSKVTGSSVEDPKIEIGSNVGDVFVQGVDATISTKKISLSDISGKTISVNGNVIDLSKANGDEVGYINKVLKEQGMGITAKLEGSDIILSSTSTGSKTAINVDSIDSGSGNFTSVIEGKNANIIVKDDKGGVYTHSSNSNTITLDGVTFKINGEIPSEGISIKGKNDVSNAKDMIVNFIQDYNKLMENLNTLTMEKRDKSYMPLTDEQKKDMSETEIKLWNERLNKGQLSRDSDISRIANSMKTAMRGLVEGADGNLEKFGISPVPDYQGTGNGTFTINEMMLTEALENNCEEVMKFFISSPSSQDSTLTEQQKYNKMGVAQRIKKVLYDETVTVSSALIKKAGIEGSSTVGLNQLTKSIETYDKKIKDMEKDFSRREQAFYSKYAKLETMMNKLNSQQNYLLSQLGMN